MPAFLGMMICLCLAAAPLLPYALSAEDSCRDIDLQLASRRRIIYAKSASIYVTGNFSAAALDLTRLELSFEPALIKGVDYELQPVVEYQLPAPYRKEARHMNAFLMVLNGNKVWITSNGNTDTRELVLTRARYCGGSKNAVSPMVPLNIATVRMHSDSKCPTLKNLPGVPQAFQTYIDSILSFCHHPKILTIQQLRSSKMSSLRALSIYPPILFVDARKTDIHKAALVVDSFLASRSVLDVVWEPASEREPMWWILMSKPRGMPGHLFALLDVLQWKHPFVHSAKTRFKDDLNCTRDRHCTPGCPNTKVVVAWRSGYGATTRHWGQQLLDSIYSFRPLQIAPLSLRRAFTAPSNHTGWHYTLEGCPSHFLDCYFLDHSPCPPIRMDVEVDLGKALFNTSRLSELHPPHRDRRPPWWKALVGEETSDIPEDSLLDLGDHHANQVLYSYFMRPKYRYRRALDAAVKAFYLKQDSCVFMHVRRGDAILDNNQQSRAYMAVHIYVQAIRPVMDVLGLKTILLLTDDEGAIREANECRVNHPALCSDLTFRYVDAQRWKGAEGGWENPFSSGNASAELFTIQLELNLAQKCVMGVVGESNYGQLVAEQVGCQFPSVQRGRFPQRCLKVPTIRIGQYKFTCEMGNTLQCKKLTVTDYVFKPDALKEAISFSKSDKALWKFPSSVYYHSVGEVAVLQATTHSIFENKTKSEIEKYGREVKKYFCVPVKDRAKHSFC